MNIDIIFCRKLLSLAHADVRSHLGIKAPMKAAWVYHLSRDHWEFHGPDGFYWHGSAGNAYDARYKGWSALLEHRRIEYKSKARKAVAWSRHQRLAGRHRWAVVHLNRACLFTRVALAWRVAA